MKKLYAKWLAFLTYLRSPVLLAMRLYWGYHFFLTGRGKLLNLDRTTDFFQSLHIPLPKLNAIVAGSTECVGGILLLIGLGSRIVTVPLIFILCMAYATAERESLNAIFSNPDKFVTADPFLFLLCCMIVLVFGPGLISVDGLISRTSGRKKD